MHTRVVTTKDSKGHSHKYTETYWTWDYHDSIEKNVINLISWVKSLMRK